MKNKTFFEQVTLKERNLSDITKFISEWLKTDRSTNPLFTAIGMTVSQYNRWISSPTELKIIFNEYKRTH